ncbi:MAG: hypothetical protein KDA86_22115 [Planctomycetaceae bacterium]|nr:hypothetical protein [Planctomycetaceae bacterium]MCA9113238.1 hypothetical protein [Planctomycetaceae bacterium]
MLHELLTQPWWTYDPQTTGTWGHVYRWFNLFEGTVWFVFAGLVIHRWRRHRKSSLEPVYALTFLLFGLTDFREASAQSAGLVIMKAIILSGLFGLRQRVMHAYGDRRNIY